MAGGEHSEERADGAASWTQHSSTQSLGFPFSAKSRSAKSMKCKQQSVLQMFIPSKDFSLEIGLYQYMNKMKWLGFGLGSFVTDLLALK